MDRDLIAYLVNVLRHGTIKWRGRSNALRKARKKVIENGKTKLHWQCNNCKTWFRDQSNMEVDHIEEVGGYRGSWDDFIKKMYNEKNLQVLCGICHLKKTKAFLHKLRRKEKNV